MKNQLQNKLNFEERQLQRRNRKVNSLRFKQGIKELFSKKIKLITFLIFIITAIIIWFLFIYKPNNLDIFRMLIYILFWLFVCICIWGIITWFGKPKKAQKIEDGIKDIFNIEELHKIPILNSITKGFDGLFIYSFYSPDYSKEEYEKRRKSIEQKLSIVISGEIENKGDFIRFNAISKKNIKLKGELKDDRI